MRLMFYVYRYVTLLSFSPCSVLKQRVDVVTKL